MNNMANGSITAALRILTFNNVYNLKVPGYE
jgi:hypothetical protein